MDPATVMEVSACVCEGAASLARPSPTLPPTEFAPASPFYLNLAWCAMFLPMTGTYFLSGK
jgi:hypothetical protein